MGHGDGPGILLKGTNMGMGGKRCPSEFGGAYFGRTRCCIKVVHDTRKQPV